MATEQEARFERALEVHAGVFGLESAEMLRSASQRGYRTPAMRDFVELTLAHGMVDMWSRPGLDLRSRSMVQIAALMTMREWDPLETHIRLGLRNGLSPDEVMEVILQTTVYGGQAMGNTAFGIANRVFKEAGVSADTKSAG
jgi:alkylhydroperoxidase/carboxymuconolactone decarboxylase family protein YurZ